MNRRQTLLVTLLVLAVLTSGGISQAGGDSNKTLKGTYGFSGSGTLMGGTVQAAIVGLNSFDRAGGCDITAKINAFGAVTDVHAVTCTYSVNPDGTGGLDVTFDRFPGEFHSDFVIVDNAKEILSVLSDASGGTVATAVTKRQTAE